MYHSGLFSIFLFFHFKIEWRHYVTIYFNNIESAEKKFSFLYSEYYNCSCMIGCPKFYCLSLFYKTEISLLFWPMFLFYITLLKRFDNKYISCGRCTCIFYFNQFRMSRTILLVFNGLLGVKVERIDGIGNTILNSITGINIYAC